MSATLSSSSCQCAHVQQLLRKISEDLLTTGEDLYVKMAKPAWKTVEIHYVSDKKFVYLGKREVVAKLPIFSASTKAVIGNLEIKREEPKIDHHRLKLVSKSGQFIQLERIPEVKHDFGIIRQQDSLKMFENGWRCCGYANGDDPFSKTVIARQKWIMQ